MSHTTAIKAIQITDIAALQSAVSDLNRQGIKCSLTKDATPRAFYPNQAGLGKADYVLHLDAAAYDIGFYRTGQTTAGLPSYEARTDFWGGSVQKVLGTQASSPETADQARMGKLFQAYAICATENFLISQGKSFDRHVAENGEIQLIAQY